VSNREERDAEWSEFDRVAGNDRMKPGELIFAVSTHLRGHHREREVRPVDVDASAHLAKKERQDKTMSEALKAFDDELQSKNFKGYWQNVQGDVYREPVPSFQPCFWKGKNLFAAMEKAGELVGLDVSFRRVIQLWNPSLKNSATRTLVLNLQTRKPGEEALSHRLMAGAIRFILKGHGTRLIVEGESFEIGEGDFATTPSWT
jgi:gentisate 1,2-dioxygenase